MLYRVLDYMEVQFFLIQFLKQLHVRELVARDILARYDDRLAKEIALKEAVAEGEGLGKFLMGFDPFGQKLSAVAGMLQDNGSALPFGAVNHVYFKDVGQLY